MSEIQFFDDANVQAVQLGSISFREEDKMPSVVSGQLLDWSGKVAERYYEVSSEIEHHCLKNDFDRTCLDA